MSIVDKLKKRIELFEYYEIHFNSTNKEIMVRNYERLIIKLSKLLIEFLGINLEKYSHEINRIRVMFYCELESLNKNYSYKLINHIPFSILEDLKDKIVDLEEFHDLKLDQLFLCYKEMYELFLHKPYDAEE